MIAKFHIKLYRKVQLDRKLMLMILWYRYVLLNSQSCFKRPQCRTGYLDWVNYRLPSYLHLGWILQFSVSSHTPQFFFVFPFILILPLSWLFLSSVFVEHQGLYAVTWLQVPSMSSIQIYLDFILNLSKFYPNLIKQFF